MKAKQVYNKMVKGVKAVSPIVATLVLVLVAVGSATAYYGWQNGWQENIEGQASDSANIKSSLTITGSSTVYEFTAAAAPAFEQANGVKIDFVSGGSGAGIANIGHGVCDIGSASRMPKDSELDQYPDLNRDGNKDYGRDLMVHTVAWDAVVVIVSDDLAADGATNLTRDQLLRIYNGSATGTPDWADDITATYDRSDDSGTAEVMRELLMGIDEDDLTGTEYAVDGVFTEVGSNQEMIAAIEDATGAIGFTSWGMATEEGLNILAFDGTEDDSPVTADADTIMSGEYDGARPINYITVGEPTGDIAEYLQFVKMAKNNQNFAEAAGYIPVYD